MHGTDPTASMLTRRVREHRLDRRLAHAAPNALEQDQCGSNLPVTGKSDGWNCDQINRIARERDDPVSTGSIGEVTSDGSREVVEKLAQARGDADDRSACAEHRQEGAVHARAAGVRRIAEEIDDPHQQYEAKGGRTAI